MIKILGFQRVVILVVLIGLNALFAAAVYAYVQPEKITKERQLRSVRGQVSSVRSDIDRLQVEFDKLEEQRAEFDALSKRGFFKGQGRREAELIFKKIQDQSGVIAAIASIESGRIEDHEEAEKAEHKILESPVTIRLEALEDLDVFRYVYLIEKFFPGHITIESIDLRREADVSGTVLRSIASGNNPPLVKADINLLWRTMIPNALVAERERNGQ